MSDQVIYPVEGTVQASGGIYISRDADEELLRLCRAGEFCYVLAARQTGKSSLMVATRERLAAEGIRSVEIDLTQMGSRLTKLTAEQWYLGLIDFIVDQLDLDVDYMAWWDERARLGPTQRLSQFLRQVALEKVSEPVVIFIDEIDSTLKLDFTDDFFAAIRACYNARASDPAFKRLSFVLLGVATPTDLIKDPTRTPFNIGRRVDLTDFTERQAIPLAAGLDLPPGEAAQVLIWILDWTGGHPYLAQRLCATAATSPTKNWDAATVDKLVEKTFFGEQSAQDSNLRFVRDMLTQRAPDKAAVLKTYRRIHAGKAVPDEERSLVKTHLKLSGIVKRKGDNLAIRNEIYRRVFDLAWVRENTAVKRAPIVAGIAVFVALLAVGAILYNAWVGIQFQDNIANFYQTSAPEERVAHLAKIFGLQGLFGPTDYDYQARELFYGLSREEQLALFNVYNVEDSDLIVVMKGLYITLADIDGTDSTGPLLEAMVQALDYLDETEETKKLEGEINNWLEGRKLAKQNQYADALAEYNKAIELNGENPATFYERARLLTELTEYQQALGDLDQVMAIARRAPAPTPTLSPTITPTASSPSTTMLTTLPALNLTSISTPGMAIIPTETLPSASVTATLTLLPIATETPVPTATPTPAAVTSEFATIGQIISAVRKIIDGHPNLGSFLASAPSSAYPNLREFGLVPNQTPIAVISGPTSGSLGETLSFSGAESTDEDGHVVSYEWDFGDGTTSSGVSVTHVYTAPGSYKVTLTVADDGGGTDQASVQTGMFTYIVQSGDTLMSISRKFFNGDPQYWDEIVDLNDMKAPYTLYPGQVIKIPESLESGLVPTPTLIPPGEIPLDLTLTLVASPTTAVTPTATPTLMPTVTPTPPTATRIPTLTLIPTPTYIIEFSASKTIVDPGEWVTLRWRVENVQAVYLDWKGGVGAPGEGLDSRQMWETTDHTLRVVLKNGETVTRTITITVTVP